jgi:hypothetical protein
VLFVRQSMTRGPMSQTRCPSSYTSRAGKFLELEHNRTRLRERLADEDRPQRPRHLVEAVCATGGLDARAMQVCRQPLFHLLPRRRPSDILVCRACGRKCQIALPEFQRMTMPPKEAEPRHMCKQAHNPLRPAALRTMRLSPPPSPVPACLGVAQQVRAKTAPGPACRGMGTAEGCTKRADECTHAEGPGMAVAATDDKSANRLADMSNRKRIQKTLARAFA